MIRNHYAPLDQVSPGPSESLTIADPSQLALLRLDSPALEAMTDLRKTRPVSTDALSSLEQARLTMIVSGVRLLFVRSAAGHLQGLITAPDVLGERAVLKAHQSGRTVPELSVSDVMTPLREVECLDVRDVAKSEVGHIVATLKAHGRQHALVIERTGQRNLQVIGLFSSTQIARQMGIPIDDPMKANTFAEIEAAIAVT